MSKHNITSCKYNIMLLLYQLFAGAPGMKQSRNVIVQPHNYSKLKNECLSCTFKSFIKCLHSPAAFNRPLEQTNKKVLWEQAVIWVFCHNILLDGGMCFPFFMMLWAIYKPHGVMTLFLWCKVGQVMEINSLEMTLDYWTTLILFFLFLWLIVNYNWLKWT